MKAMHYFIVELYFFFNKFYYKYFLEDFFIPPPPPLMNEVPPPPPPPQQMELTKVNKPIEPDPRSALLESIRSGKKLKVSILILNTFHIINIYN